jgi:hypothetical protein
MERHRNANIQLFQLLLLDLFLQIGGVLLARN